MSLLRRPAVHVVLAVLLGAVFVYASVDKILHPREFAKIVYHYQVIGPSKALGFVPANLLAITLPWIEAALGVALITQLWRREAAALAGALLVVFLFAVSWALAHGIDIEKCGCFSVTAESRSAGLKLLLQDVALLACSVVLAAFPPRPVAVAEVAQAGTPVEV